MSPVDRGPTIAPVACQSLFGNSNAVCSFNTLCVRHRNPSDLCIRARPCKSTVVAMCFAIWPSAESESLVLYWTPPPCTQPSGFSAVNMYVKACSNCLGTGDGAHRRGKDFINSTTGCHLYFFAYQSKRDSLKSATATLTVPGMFDSESHFPYLPNSFIIKSRCRESSGLSNSVIFKKVFLPISDHLNSRRQRWKYNVPWHAVLSTQRSNE